jgi:exopolyphosphatase/guanosine-5'-triphosphate,3'-diphosphate pyrophosphatase
MSEEDVSRTVERLRKMSYRERVENGCIGPDRADLVLAGCAILEAIRRAFPAERVRIADRGLREGILLQLMQADRAKGRAGQR